MSSMKDYKRAVDHFNVPDRVEDVLFAEQETGTAERRIEKHSAWQKPAMAAAVAAVVGLNVFAVMKIRQETPKLNPGAEGSGQSETQKADLPDLSAFGIDTSAFAFRGSVLTAQEGEWLYQDEMPKYKWQSYRTEGDTAEIMLDETGRFLSYQRLDVTEDTKIDDSEMMDSEAAKERSLELVKTVSGKEPEEMLLTGEVSEGIDSYYYNYAYHLEGADCPTDTVSAVLAKDGAVSAVKIDYTCMPENIDAFDAEAMRLYTALYPEAAAASFSESPIIDKTFHEVNGTVLGSYLMQAMDKPNEGAMLLVRAEGGDLLTEPVQSDDSAQTDTPDFSALSSNVFFKLGEQEAVPIRGIWPYDTERPAAYFDAYVSDAGEKILTNEWGDLISYQAPENMAVSADHPYDDNELYQKAYDRVQPFAVGASKLILQEKAHMEGYDVFRFFGEGYDGVTVCELLYEQYTEGTPKSLTVDYADFNYPGVEDHQADLFQQEAERLVAEGKFANANYCWYVSWGGRLYAKYLTEMDKTGKRDRDDCLIVYSEEGQYANQIDDTDKPVITDSTSLSPFDSFVNTLTDMGICTGSETFTAEAEPYTGGEFGCVLDQQIWGYWLYDTPRPHEDWTAYTAADGMQIVTDANGIVRRFCAARRPGNPEEAYDAAEAERLAEFFRQTADTNAYTARKILNAVFPGYEWSIQPEDSHFFNMSNDIWEMVFTRTENGAEAKDKAYFYFDKDGNLDTFVYNMPIVSQVDDTLSAMFDAEAARLLSEKLQMPDAKPVREYVDTFGGSIYGIYQFTDNAGSPARLIVDLNGDSAQ